MKTKNLSFAMQKLTATNHPSKEESGHEFLVIVNDGILYYSIAKWYNKGDKVSLELKPEFVQESLKTADETNKMLYSIFGTLTKTVTVREDGFYTILPDSSLSEHRDCSEWLASCMADNQEIYWCDLPEELE